MKDEVQLELEDVERKLKSSHRNADVNVAYNLNTGTGGTGRSTRHSDHSDHSTGTSAQTVQREARELQRLKLQLEHFLHRLSRNKIYTRNSEVDNYDEACLKKTKPPLVFVIGLRDHERQCLITILEQWGTPTELLPTEVTNENGSNAERSLLYSRGGVFLVTSRILIVDLLTHVASPRDIDGILVAHAEIVTEQSTEAFILRIFRTQKRFGLEQHSAAGGGGGGELETNSPMIQSMQYGFVKAFSDAPASLVSGFAKVDKILKALFVRRIYIYPRFHDVVSQELERTPPMVEELHQSLSPKMIEIQAAIAAAVKACIRELKKSVSIIDWTDAELTLENCVTTNFDLKISRQLDADWHRLKPATKQLVNDLKQLRTLFQYLLQYDCIAFWKLINSIKMIGASSRNPSMWLLSGAANVMFKIAKERMYTIVNGNKATKKNPIPVKKLIPHLEENPKWRLLHQVGD
jgi:DNA excision repair protein ERCC-4